MPESNAVAEGVRYLLEQQFLVRAPLRQIGTDTPLGPFAIGPVAPFSLPGQAFVEVGRLRYYVKRTSVILGFWISCNVAPTGASMIAGLRINGTLTGTQAIIPIGGFVSPEVRPGAQFLAPDEYVQMDIIQVGSTLPGGDVVGHMEIATAEA
jgi:hypothetical protein